MIESGVTFDLAQLVMDAEIARLVKRSLQGMPVSDETLAVDDIVGGRLVRRLPEPGRDPQAHARPQPAAGCSTGASGRTGRAPARRTCTSGRGPRRRKILAEHVVPPLPDGVAAEVEAILTRAEAEAAAR